MNSRILSSLQGKHTSTQWVMLQVCLALIPGIAVMTWLFGVVVLVQLTLAITTALAFEAIVMALRNRPVAPAIFDGSALVSAMLLALSIPPIAPWWLVVIGTFFTIIFGKQLYGGLGNNIFNPAMLGFVVLMISFPKQMTLWNTVGFYHGMSMSEQINLVFNGIPNIDSITGATPLGGLNTALNKGETAQMFFSQHPLGALGIKQWELINLAFLLGGIILWARKIISWHIPLAVLFSLTFFALVFHLSNPETYPPAGFHLFSGATMIGAFFIATDPVTASTTIKGKIIYGIGIGFFLFIIRSFGSYHDAIAFSVLLMNMAVPLIDTYTKPKPFGTSYDG